MIPVKDPNHVERPDTQAAKVDVSLPGARAAVSGGALAVVAIVALLGLIVVAVMAVGVAQRAVDRTVSPPSAPAVDRPRGDVASVHP